MSQASSQDPETEHLLGGMNEHHYHNPSSSPSNPNNELLLETAIHNAYRAFHDVVSDEHSDGRADNDDSDVADVEEEEDEDIIWLRQQRQMNKTLHWTKRPSSLMIGFALFATGLASNMMAPSIQVIFNKLACNSLIESGPEGTSTCNPIEVQILTANYLLASSVVGSVVSIIASAKYGQLSDVYGRKPFLIWFIVCGTVSTLCTYYLISHYKTFQFAALLASDVLINVGGGVATAISLCKAYISDITEAHERIYSLGLVTSSIMMGMSLAPVVTSLIIKWSKSLPKTIAPGINIKTAGSSAEDALGTFNRNRPQQGLTYQDIDRSEYVPIQVGLVLMFLITLYFIFILPESRGAKARSKSRSFSVGNRQQVSRPSLITRITDAINFWKPLRLIWLPPSTMKPQIPTTMRARVRPLFITMTVSGALIAATSASISLVLDQYGIYQFNWTAVEINRLLFFRSVGGAVVLLVISPFLSNYLLVDVFKLKVLPDQYDMVDHWMSIIAFAFQSVGLIMGAFAPTSNQMMAFFTLTSVGGIADPALTSASIKYLPDSKVGEYFGGVSVLHNLCNVVVPSIVVGIYKFGLAHGIPQIPFLLYGGLVLTTWMALSIGKRWVGLSSRTRSYNHIPESADSEITEVTESDITEVPGQGLDKNTTHVTTTTV